MNRKVLFMCLLVLCLGMMAGSAFAAVTEFVVNPGFESPTNGTPWYNQAAWGACTGATTTAEAHAGVQSWQTQGAAIGAIDTVEQNVPGIIGGLTYAVSYWVKIPTASAITPAKVDIRAWFGNAGNWYISGFWSAGGSAGITVNTPDWVQITDGVGGFTPAATCTQVLLRCRITSLAPTMVAYVDDASVTANVFAISGTITLGDASDPAGAVVSCAGKTVTVGSSGAYSFAVGPGTYTVSASKTNYDTTSAVPDVVVTTADVTGIDIVLPKSPTSVLSGTISGLADNSGLVVRAADAVNPLVYTEATSNSVGFYTMDLAGAPGGAGYNLTITNVPAGKMVISGPVGGIAPPASGQNFVIGDDPEYDVDLLFSAKSSACAGTAPWPLAYTSLPTTTSLTQMDAPATKTINGQLWEANYRTEPWAAPGNTGFRFKGPVTSGFATNGFINPIAINGASIVVAIRPIRKGVNDNWQSIVDVFYDRLCLVIRNGDGLVGVRRNSNWGTNWAPGGTAIPNGQITVLSLVVQSDSSYEVFANGVSIMTGAASTAGSFTSLRPNHNGSQPGDGDWGWDGEFTHYINVGRNNPDGWTAFNGNIGDVYFYKVAIDATKRTTLESAMTAKYGTWPVYTINSSVSGVGGTITPAGAISVPGDENKSFTITPSYGYLTADVLVNGVSQGAIGSYTFSTVAANHTIVASFNPLPSFSGVVSGPSGPINSAKVTLSDGSFRFANAAGQYLIVPPADGVYTLTASKGGYVTGSIPATMAGAPVTGLDILLAKSAGLDPLVVLDASVLTVGADLASWPNTGTLGGSYERDLVGPNVVADIGGKQAVEFIQLTQDSAGRRNMVSAILAPAEITGASDWTISTDLYRANMLTPGGENSYFNWSGRDTAPGWPNSQFATAQFSYVNNLAYVMYGADSGFVTVPAAGVWNNVTVTYDGVSQKVYVNGALDSTNTWTLRLNPNALMMVGGAHWREARYEDQYWRFNGAIAKLQIFDQALSATEVGIINGLIAITGKVTLADGTTGVGGATVNGVGGLLISSTTTNPDGTYSLSSKVGDTVDVSASKAGYVVTSTSPLTVAAGATGVNFVMALPNVTGTVKTAGGAPIYNAVVQIGVGGPAAITNAAGEYTVSGITAGSDVSAYADALGYADNTQIITTIAGVNTQNFVLAPKDESDASYIQNGGFETGTLAGWTADPATTIEMGVTTAQKASGSYAGYWKGLTGVDYYQGYLTQSIPVVAGSAYNVYFKTKTVLATAVTCEGQCGFNFGDWWGYDGLGTNWMFTPVYGTWEQAQRYRLANNTAKLTAVRVAIPAGVTTLDLVLGLGTITPGDTLYIDDVVVDRVGPVYVPPVTGPTYGVNNKSVLTDDKLITRKVKVWGMVTDISGQPASYTISDGYTTGVTINGATGKIVGDMAVVIGVVQADRSVTATP